MPVWCLSVCVFVSYEGTNIIICAKHGQEGNSILPELDNTDWWNYSRIIKWLSIMSWICMTTLVHSNSWVYSIVAFLLLASMTRNSGSRFGVAGVFATASSALHLSKAQTDTELWDTTRTLRFPRVKNRKTMAHLKSVESIIVMLYY